MPQLHVVQAGECLISIAKDYGFPDWKTIYNAPDNADFRQQRPNPNVVFVGDQIVIPDPKSKKVSCTTEQNHKFKMKTSKCVLRVVVKDEDEQPITGKKYVLLVGDKRIEGTTTGDGHVEQTVDPSHKSADLTVYMTDDPKGERFHYNLCIGYLDPIDEPHGVQARLNNLGFYCGDNDGVLGPKSVAALKAFQKANNIPVTGQVDDATKGKLMAGHGKI